MGEQCHVDHLGQRVSAQSFGLQFNELALGVYLVSNNEIVMCEDSVDKVFDIRQWLIAMICPGILLFYNPNALQNCNPIIREPAISVTS